MIAKNRFVLFAAVLLAASVACKRQGQDAGATPPAAAPQPPPPIEVPAGTTVEARIDQTLSTRRSHPGQRFHASLAAPLLVAVLVMTAPPLRVVAPVALKLPVVRPPPTDNVVPMLALAVICNWNEGEVVPMPTLPCIIILFAPGSVE